MAVADNDIGCGVGTQIMEGQSGLPAKVLGSFINGLTFQSISLTFGLVNCDGQGTVTADASEMKLRHYASQNFDRLAEDMARGEGERLEAVAYLLDVQASDRAAFRSLTQQNFEELFPHDQVTVGEMLDSLDSLLSRDSVLSEYARS
jgi:hypothetical protein